MFARFDENPTMTLRVIKETKRYRRTDARTDNVKTVYPLQTKFAGGVKIGVEGFSQKPSTPIFFVCLYFIEGGDENLKNYLAWPYFSTKTYAASTQSKC